MDPINEANQFKCLEFKWKIQEQIYNETKNMSWEQKVTYFRQSAKRGQTGDWYQKVKQNMKNDSKEFDD